MPLQQIVPTWLAINACNDTSDSGFTDLRLGIVVKAGGLNLGDYFDLTNGEAARNSYAVNGLLYEGRYRRVLVDSGATASNVKTGTIGLMPSLAAVIADGDPQGKPTVNIVTSYDKGVGSTTAVRFVVFLNTVTPGNYCFVQELGIASVLGKTSLTNATPAVGDSIIATTSGLVDDPTQSGQPTYTQLQQIVGNAVDLPKSTGLFRVLLSNINFPVVQG
jgi:hypothetical protein